jgi:hypothetical protein
MICQITIQKYQNVLKYLQKVNGNWNTFMPAMIYGKKILKN